jgi:serine/threonine-protein kinase
MHLAQGLGEPTGQLLHSPPKFGSLPPDPESFRSASAESSPLTAIWPGDDSPPRLLLPEPHEDEPPIVWTQSAAPPAPLGGSVGRYQVLGEIARGGMGVVLKARDADLGRDLALKVLHERHRDDPGVTRRFVEEAQIGGQLQHPGIVPVHELGALADRRPFFTMKLVKGRTLAALLAERRDHAGRASADAALRPVEDLPASHDEVPRFLPIFEAVCQTVAYAHARRVIHRDLKPANVMVGHFGEVQVMDWGLAKVLPEGGIADEERAQAALEQETLVQTVRSGPGGSGSDSQAGSVLGTPSYMAPEQARGEIERIDERADVFGLAAILCEILTGRPAFVGKSREEIRAKAMRADLAGAHGRLDTCQADGELIALARDCLAAARDDRPRDAGEVALRMSAYQAGVQERLQAAERARVQAQTKAAEERKRRRLSVALAASLLAMGTLGGLTYTYLLHQRQTRIAARELRLGRASTLLDQARKQPEDPALWRTALAAAQQVEADTGEMDAEARGRLDVIKAAVELGLRRAESDATLRQRLVEIRANHREVGPELTDAAYVEAFRAAELDLDSLSTSEAGSRLRQRPVAVVVELAAYLDHWSSVRREVNRPAPVWRKPMEVARAGDDDDYRDRLRSLLSAGDLKAVSAQFKALADEPSTADLPAPTAVLLGGALEDAGDRDRSVRLLRHAVERHPDDVWVNFELAAALNRQPSPSRADVVRYYSAARALRPETAHELAHLLEQMNRGEEAEAVFRDLVRRRPDARNLACFGKCLKNRGSHSAARGMVARALSAAREAIRAEPEGARAHFQLAYVLQAQSKPSEAEAEYRTALKLKPDYASAHNNLGAALMDQGKLAEAEAEYRAALKLKPDYADAHSNLGTALADQGKLAEAEAECRASLELKPDDAVAHNTLGSALRLQGKLAEAEAQCRAALKLKPDYAEAHANLGVSLRLHGKLAEAEAQCRAALKLKPDYAAAHHNLGVALKDQGKLAEAEAEYRAALKLKPDDPEAHTNLGNALKDQGKLAEAEAEHRAALKLKPDLAETHNNLGNALKDQGKLAEAEAEYRAALKLNPDLAGTHNNLGIALVNQGKPTEAEAECRAALKLKPDLAETHINLGVALHGQGKLAEAEAEFRAALKLKPDLAAAHHNLGVALNDQGKPAQAESEYRAALELKPDDAEAHHNLGDALRLQGKLAEAEAEFRAALRLKPTYALAHCMLGHLLRQAGRYADALNELRRGHELGSRQPNWRCPSAQWVRDCERLVALDARLPAILKGTDHPASAAEGLVLAQMCYDRKLQAAAARLYSEALRAEPTLAEDRQAQHPYNAACAAALAGCGQGKDDPPLDEGAKTRWRKQALDWLKAELATWSKVVESGPPQARPGVVQALQHWKVDPDLAGLRDQPALAKLPADEQKAFRALWVQVDSMLAKARAAAKR